MQILCNFPTYLPKNQKKTRFSALVACISSFCNIKWLQMPCILYRTPIQLAVIHFFITSTGRHLNKFKEKILHQIKHYTLFPAHSSSHKGNPLRTSHQACSTPRGRRFCLSRNPILECSRRHILHHHKHPVPISHSRFPNACVPVPTIFFSQYHKLPILLSYASCTVSIVSVTNFAICPVPLSRTRPESSNSSSSFLSLLCNMCNRNHCTSVYRLQYFGWMSLINE